MNATQRLAVVGLVIAAVACSPTDPDPVGPTELEVQDLRLGTGTEATAGRVIVVDYVGWLYHPDRPENKAGVFDTSLTGDPFEFVLGVGAVIRGWDVGVAGMKEGGVRRLVVPPAFGYGSERRGTIPPSSTLVFEIELLEVR